MGWPPGASLLLPAERAVLGAFRYRTEACDPEGSLLDVIVAVAIIYTSFFFLAPWPQVALPGPSVDDGSVAPGGEAGLGGGGPALHVTECTCVPSELDFVAGGETEA